MTELLIDQNDVLLYFQISKGRDQESFNRYIREAQEFDFKPLVGELFYHCLIQQRDNERMQALIKGTTYEHKGQKISFEGIRYLLAHFTFAAYLLKSSLNDTPFGMVSKQNDFSCMIGYDEKDRLYKRYRAQGFLLMEDLNNYLKRHPKVYPEWQAKEQKSRTSSYSFTLVQ